MNVVDGANHEKCERGIKMEDKTKTGITTKSVVLAGMFAAVLAVLAQVAVPMPTGVSVTLQTFAVALTGYVLGWKLGTLSVGTYLLLGAVGAPVFTGLNGGLGILFGKSGGFLFGFLFLVICCGFGIVQKHKLWGGVAALTGLMICHLLGVLQFAFLANVSFGQAVVLVSLPYLVKDAISLILAFVAGNVLKKALNAAHILTYQENA